MPEAILVVDDDTVISAFLRMLLEQQGHEVRCAGSAAEALALAAEHRPSLIVSDLRLADGSGGGPEIIAQIRRSGPVPALALTGEQLTPEAFAALGFDAGLVKPVRIPALLAAITQVLATSRA